MVELKIYVFRHGQTAFNRDGKFTGHIDSKITKKGRGDARMVSERLKKKQIQLAFHSSLSRSKDTLKIVLKKHPECKLVLQDDRIIERDYGAIAGMSHHDLLMKKGSEYYDKCHRGLNTRTAKTKSDWKAGFHTGPPKGESFADVEVRVKNFIKDLIKMMKKEKMNVAISAHGNSIRLFRKIMEGLDHKKTIGLNIAYDNYYEYTIKA